VGTINFHQRSSPSLTPSYFEMFPSNRAFVVRIKLMTFSANFDLLDVFEKG
jgi:hypothetical protein